VIATDSEIRLVAITSPANLALDPSADTTAGIAAVQAQPARWGMVTAALFCLLAARQSAADPPYLVTRCASRCRAWSDQRRVPHLGQDRTCTLSAPTSVARPSLRTNRTDASILRSSSCIRGSEGACHHRGDLTIVPKGASWLGSTARERW
jgi:hypothetical protein